MSIPTSSLEAIQQAGAAVFAADAQLKSLVKDYAERVHAAVLSNPYNLGNDNLFENWKIVARLSQTLTSMEEELRKVYQVASELGEEQVTIHALTAPLEPAPGVPASAIEPSGMVSEQPNVTDVKIKKKKVLSAPVTPRARRSQTTKTRSPAKPATGVQASAKPGGQAAAHGNAARLMAYFERALNARKFVGVNQTAVSREAGIPLGSMTAALKQLLAGGQLIAGGAGQYKLAH